jgi:hypothetical protein
MVHTSRLRGSATDISSLLQVDRIRAVQDNRFYSVYVSGVNANGSSLFVDLNGTQAYSTTPQADPMITISSEVQAISQGSAPNSNGLYNLFLPPGSTVTANDGSVSGSPVTFSSRGLPCLTQTAINGATSGQVCDSAGGAVPYWIFLQDTVTGDYMAVTVNPAGRIMRWIYSNGAWASI